MKTNKEMINNLSRNIVSKMIKKDSTGWPPDCSVYAYQPVRPRSSSTFSEERTSSKRSSRKRTQRF